MKKLKYIIRWLLFIAIIVYFTFFKGSYSSKDIIIYLLLLLIESTGLFLMYKKDKSNALLK